MTGSSEMCESLASSPASPCSSTHLPSRVLSRHLSEIVLATLLFIYCIYLFTLLVLSFSRIMALSSPFKFIFTVTLFVYISVMTSLFAGYFYPLATSAIVFLSIYSIMNFYIWTLAFAYAPIGTDDGSANPSVSLPAALSLS
jgi:hypothetical protein